jgi:hypothetical protein
MSEDTLATEGTVSAPEQEAPEPSVNEAPRAGTAMAESHRAPVAAGERGIGNGRIGLGRHELRGHETTVSREISQDRRARLRVLAGSLIGSACLVVAVVIQPGQASPFAGLSNVSAWIAFIAGIAGIWLVPGLWLSAVMMRIGAGPSARLATRIGATLTWYALVGPIVHNVADGALVTRGGIVGVTVAATAAMCLGVALGMVRRPPNPWLRFLMAGLLGALCAQIVIWLSMLLVSGVNYEQIRRLDWLIVLSCGFLTAVGAHSRPDLPMIRRVKHLRVVLVSLAVVAVTALTLFAVGSIWSPAQRMPSTFGAEQVDAPPGSDVAFALTAMGPDGLKAIEHSAFSASDEIGQPVSVATSVVAGETPGSATLLVVLDPQSRPQLCERGFDATEQGWPVKLTVRDQTSGLVVQAVLPAEWCVS